VGSLAEGPHPATTERVTLDGRRGTVVAAIHARPSGEILAGLVVHPDIMGVRPLFDDLCRRLATHGLVVCAPEPFARAAEDVRAASEPTRRMEHVRDLDDDAQLGDLVHAADWLASTHAVDRVHALGFCIGGMYTLKAAATGRFDHAVAFYGMLKIPDAWQGRGQREPLDAAAKVCPTLAIFGGADEWTPPGDIAALRELWRDRPDCEIVVYEGAEHGFVHDPDRPAHRPDDAADAWKRALAFLGVG